MLLDVGINCDTSMNCLSFILQSEKKLFKKHKYKFMFHVKKVVAETKMPYVLQSNTVFFCSERLMGME